MIVKLNDRALAALGFDMTQIEALRHLLRITGNVAGSTTLPEALDMITQADIDPSAAQVAELRKDFEQLRVSIDSLAHVAEMQKRIDDLQAQMEGFTNAVADLAELRKFSQALEVQHAFPAPLTDWEHPGQLGARTANTAAVTALDAAGAVTLNPLNALVDLSPTGTGYVRIRPGAVGTLDNVTIGSVTPKAATVTTLTSTVATGTAPLVVTSTTQVANLYAARAALADNATSAGDLGTAGTYPADATDLASVITLANALKARNISRKV